METPEVNAIPRLLQYMDQSSGFVGLGASVEVMSHLGDGHDSDTQQVCAAILRDAALTAKLLRIANSARHARAGRNITTVEQVLALLGINTVRSVALSLALLNSLSNKPQSDLLHAEIVAAYFCGNLAFEVTRHNAVRFNPQEAQICGLMQNLSRMMATYFLFAEIERCRMLQAEENLSEEDAVLRVFGKSYPMMSAAIAHHWCLPETIEHSLLPSIDLAQAGATAAGWHQHCSALCRHLTDALFRQPQNLERLEIERCVEQYALALNLKEDKVNAWISKCLADTQEIMSGLAFPCSVEQARVLLRRGSERVQDRISSGDGMTRESESIEGRTPVAVIQQVLRKIHARCNFDCTLLCMVGSSGGLKAIAGVGRNAAVATSRFRCQGAKPDLFRAVVSRKQDAYIADLHQPAYARLLPDWYSEHLGARSIMLMPLELGDQLLGVVYGDFSELHPQIPPELAQDNVQSWRNELVQALLAGTIKTSAAP